MSEHVPREKLEKTGSHVKILNGLYEGDFSDLWRNGNNPLKRAFGIIEQSLKQSGYELEKKVGNSLRYVLSKKPDSEKFEIVIGFSEMLSFLDRGMTGRYYKEYKEVKENVVDKFSELYRLKDRSVYKVLRPFVKISDVVPKTNIFTDMEIKIKIFKEIKTLYNNWSVTYRV